MRFASIGLQTFVEAMISCFVVALCASSVRCTGAHAAPQRVGQSAHGGGRARLARCEASPRFELHGHRGARGLVPESTLPSFEQAIERGVDTLELDLHFSADGELIVWHDPEIDARHCRVDPRASAPLPPDPASSPGAALRIRALTARQLAKYRCDRNPDPAAHPAQRPTAGRVSGDDFHVVTLGELFDFMDSYSRSRRAPESFRSRARRVRYNVETKRSIIDPSIIDDGFDRAAPASPGAFERALVSLIRARSLEGRVTVQSFDVRSLRAVAELAPSVERSWLTSQREALSTALFARAQVWSPSASLVTPEVVAAAHDAGLRVVAWTVNDPAQLCALVRAGVDGVITDRPDLLAEALGR
jgi:glycerophosphoryl diester phosphodiesterase